MKWIGIDMSKARFHVALDDTRVEIFANTPKEIKYFIDVLKTIDCMPGNTTIGIEATGVYHLLFCRILTSGGWQVSVINPLLAHKVIAATLRRVKTDRHDAIAIREAVRMELGYPYADTPEVLALKTLVSERSALVKMRGQLKQMQHNHQAREEAVGMPLHDSFAKPYAVLSLEIKDIERKMSTYATDTQKLLRSIPGIGQTAAALLVAYIGDIERFSTPEKLVAYIGLDCRVHESGTSIKGVGYLTKRGNRRLRHVLFMAAFVASKKNPVLRQYFGKKTSEGKHYFSAVCAVERKLVHIIHAVWSRGTPFENR